ncbi:probable protein phosphatase 2C 60 [Tanacetum coccineum]
MYQIIRLQDDIRKKMRLHSKAGKEPGFVFPKQWDISVERIKQSKYFKALIQHSKGRIEHVAHDLDASTSFFGVYDIMMVMEACKAVSKFCAKFLHQVLEQEENSTGHIETSVQKSFIRIDEMMLEQRGWKELSALGDKINKFTGVIEGADILCLVRHPDARSWFYGDDDSNGRLWILSENANLSSSTPNSEFLDPKKKLEIKSWLEDCKIIDPLVSSDDTEYFDTFPTLEELGYHKWLLKYPKPSWVKAKDKNRKLK